jgi:SAM-dependent methyltransferase
MKHHSPGNTTAPTPDFSSARYWEARYHNGGNSGAGSYGRLADYKAAFINGFIRSNRIATVLDFGCGDGNLLSLLRLPAYVGVDVSPTTLATCTARFGARPNHRFRLFSELQPTDRADLAMSIDVIYHLIEDSVFGAYMTELFARSDKFVLVYSSNADFSWPQAHVRHRRFSDVVSQEFPNWRLVAHLPNPHGYAPDQPDSTSFADFFVYGKTIGEPCILPLPAIE